MESWPNESRSPIFSAANRGLRTVGNVGQQGPRTDNGTRPSNWLSGHQVCRLSGISVDPRQSRPYDSIAMRRIAGKFFTTLVLILWMASSLPAAGSVFCMAPGGHVAIEPVHAEGSCKDWQSDVRTTDAVLNTDHCTDVLLPTVTLPTRTEKVFVVPKIVPFALLPSTNDVDGYGFGHGQWVAHDPAVHLRSVVLLI